MVAATLGDLEMAQLLIEKGADPNAMAPDGTTALSRARDGRHAAIASLLQAKGATR
jgi:ankyrin repeat protein